MSNLERFCPSTTPDWMPRAACRGSDTLLFFGRGNRVSAHEEAKRICGQCPVQFECLNFALETNEPHGVWGGFTPPERKRIRALQHQRRRWQPLSELPKNI